MKENQIGEEHFDLFAKYLDSETSVDENQKVELLLENNKELEDEFYSLSQSQANSLKLKSKFDYNRGRLLLKSKIKEKEKRHRRLFLMRVAAVFIGFLSLGTVFMLDYSQEATVLASAAVEKIALPDSTIIYLNRGAELTYSTARLTRFNREVDLKGEGYFEVKRASRKFVVHTDNFDVQVLGTKFNISTEEANSEIALTEGNVRLFNFSTERNDIYMAPNDFVSYNAVSKTTEQYEINASLHTVWRNDFISFDDFNLSEVAEIIERVFDKKLIVEDPNLNNKVLSGSAPIDNLEDLITALSEILDKEIQFQNDTIIIK